MKRYIIPAFFIVDVGYNQGEEVAEEIAAHMQSAANSLSFGNNEGKHCLLLDEELPTAQIQIYPGEELPHTYKED